MLVLGFCGGVELVHENLYNFPPEYQHDSAAVLIEDGKVVCAIEEERLNRIKHTNKFPQQAIHFCLKSRGIHLRDLDLITYYSSKEYFNGWLKHIFLQHSHVPTVDLMNYAHHILSRGLNTDVDLNKICFVHHHYAHAMSALAVSGYESSLIHTFDGYGEGSSGMVFSGQGITLEKIAAFPASKSLGSFYEKIIAFLGYGIFDAYKVMGLAPYGNPEKYRNLLQTLYTLLPNGDYELHLDYEQLFSLFEIVVPRRKGERFTQTHQDIAASLQEAFENIAFHVIQHYQKETGQKNLCLAGGVTHNCTLTGKILRSGMFKNVFVQPAAHDAGTALGAAMYAYYQANPIASKPAKLEHVYWGTDIGSPLSILSQLKPWLEFIHFQQLANISMQTAQLLVSGYVVGWVQGRSEFGPRALGNRSIIADCRPAQNKQRINKMIKKREGYRPFAPSILEEDVDQFFDVLPHQKPFPFMTFVMNVRQDKQDLLGAVTHVDGTARIQTVSQKTNQRYWSLIHSFKELTGIPIILNTSFNNNVEPIVDSVEDAVVCFLTTGLDYLVIGDYLIQKKSVTWQNYLFLTPSLPVYVSLNQINQLGSQGRFQNFYYIKNSYDSKFQVSVSSDIFHILTLLDGNKTLANLIEDNHETLEGKAQNIVEDLMELWSQRLIVLRP
jgi:carbamoyltransferase